MSVNSAFTPHCPECYNAAMTASIGASPRVFGCVSCGYTFDSPLFLHYLPLQEPPRYTQGEFDNLMQETLISELRWLENIV